MKTPLVFFNYLAEIFLRLKTTSGLSMLPGLIVFTSLLFENTINTRCTCVHMCFKVHGGNLVLIVFSNNSEVKVLSWKVSFKSSRLCETFHSGKSDFIYIYIYK